MKNTSSILRIATVFFCVIFLFSYGVYSLLFKANEKAINIDYSNTFSPFSFEKNSSTETASQQTASTQTETKTVNTATAGSALGKVVNKSIPSGSDTAAGGVHLKNSTGVSLDIKKLLSDRLTFTISKNDKPQVLIIHTHATECFLSEDRDYYTSADLSRTTDNSKNVTELGSIIANKLNAASIKTIHDRTQHDYPSYNSSYSRAASTIKGYLKKYPSIRVVIDVHRDAIQSGTTKTKLTADIKGKRAAQIMLVMGSETGNIKNFPNWKENLKLALRLQKNTESMYPTLARPLSLMSRSYNERLTTGSMLIEIGTDANSFDEAKYSAELLSEALIKTLGEK